MRGPLPNVDCTMSRPFLACFGMKQHVALAFDGRYIKPSRRLVKPRSCHAEG